MPRPDATASRLVKGSFELHKKRLWLELANEECVLLRLPGVEHPWVGSIMGQGGSEYGVVFTRGPDAIAHMRVMSAREPSDDQMEAIDWVGVSMQALADIPPSLRSILDMAGFQARRDALAPFFVSKPPFKAPRTPNRTEQKALLMGINAILETHARDLLQPTSIHDAPHLLQLTVQGTPRSSKVTTSFVKAPPSREPRGPEVSEVSLTTRPHDLPWLDATWVVGLPPLAAMIEGTDDTVRCLVVRDLTLPDKIVAMVPLVGADPAVAATKLLEVMCGENSLERRGSPRLMAIASGPLFLAARQALEAWGIQCTHVDQDSELDAMVAGLDAALGEEAAADAAESTEPASELSQWKAADAHVTDLLIAEFESTSWSRTRLERRYFGTDPDFIDEEMLAGAIPSFIEWAACGYRPTRRSKTMAEKLLQGKAVQGRNRELLAARSAAVPSIYRVDAVDAGNTVTLEDVLRGGTLVVHDRAMSNSVPLGLLCPLKVYPAGPYRFVAVAGPPLPGLFIEAACDFLEDAGLRFDDEHLSEDAHLLGRLWTWRDAQAAAPPPQLVTSHGDPVEPREILAHVKDPHAFEAALHTRPDIDADGDDGVMRWLEPAPEGWAGEEVVCARLQLLGNELIAEVQSLPRLEKVTQWLEAMDGVTVESVRVPDQDAPSLDDSLPTVEPLPPEAAQIVSEMMRSHYAAWLDEKIPQLGNRTPRESCNDPDGRRRVARLIRTLPSLPGPAGQMISPPREELLAELGLEA